MLDFLSLEGLTPATLVPTLSSLAAYLQHASNAEAAALRDWPGFIAFMGAWARDGRAGGPLDICSGPAGGQAADRLGAAPVQARFWRELPSPRCPVLRLDRQP